MQLDLFNEIIIKNTKQEFKINNEIQPELTQKQNPKIRIQKLESIKNKFFYENLEDNYKRFNGDIDTAEKMTFLNATVIKNNSVVNYSLPYKKRYNKTSLNNLNNVNEKSKLKNSLSQEIRKKESIKNVEKWANTFKNEYKKEYQKDYDGLYSKTTRNKISKICNIFTRSLLSKYQNSKSFNQRIITFCTFTITENQKHSDDYITKNFIDFIDHLKKVKNFVINPITKERTKKEGLKLKNYVWRSETQENGNIHFHLIADTFLNQEMLRRVWNNYLKKMGYKYGYGSANVQSLKKDKKNNKILSIEGYLTKYMTKPPLKTKYKNMTNKELKRYGDIYRRPVIAKSWGCSKDLLILDYPTFYAHEATNVYNQLSKNLKKVVSENLPEYISVLVGNVKKSLRNCSYIMQKAVKQYYITYYEFLYQNQIILN